MTDPYNRNGQYPHAQQGNAFYGGSYAQQSQHTPQNTQGAAGYQAAGSSGFQQQPADYQPVYNSNGFRPPGYGQPSYPPPHQPRSPNQFQPPPQAQGYSNSNDLMTDFAAGMIQSQGKNYLQKGQALFQSKMGFLSTGDLYYLFDIDMAYVRDKMILLLLPFFGSRTFARKSEQISGGHRYQPPRKDVFAPDLYIPFMSVCTYIVLFGAIQYHHQKFTPDNMYITGSSAFTGWAIQWLAIKVILYLLSVPSGMPALEILAYAGYPFFYACLGVLADVFGGLWAYRIVIGYGTLATASFLIRTLKHVLFQDGPRHSRGAAKHNWVLFGLGAFQFPFLWWYHA